MKTTSSLPHAEPSGANLGTELPFGYGLPLSVIYPELSFQWGVYKKEELAPVAYGQIGFFALASRLSDLLKLERQHQERLAAVSLDACAQRLLSALDKKTSIQWEDLPASAEGDWCEVSRAATLLAGANLCDANPTRIRLSEHGDRLLAESRLYEQMDSQVGPTPVP